MGMDRGRESKGRREQRMKKAFFGAAIFFFFFFNRTFAFCASSTSKIDSTLIEWQKKPDQEWIGGRIARKLAVESNESEGKWKSTPVGVAWGGEGRAAAQPLLSFSVTFSPKSENEKSKSKDDESEGDSRCFATRDGSEQGRH